jgi:hypothetical protein
MTQTHLKLWRRMALKVLTAVRMKMTSPDLRGSRVARRCVKSRKIRGEAKTITKEGTTSAGVERSTFLILPCTPILRLNTRVRHLRGPIQTNSTLEGAEGDLESCLRWLKTMSRR